MHVHHLDAVGVRNSTNIHSQLVVNGDGNVVGS